MQPIQSQIAPDSQIHPDKLLRRVSWRIIPFMIFLFILNYLDRTNVAFAKLQMNTALGFSEGVYGMGASTFFLGYFFFEVPSNLIMEKVGARRWMARIMITWGLISSCMMFIHSATGFYLLRFALGAAEAGFFPGMLLYLTYWIPARQRARAVAWFLTSIAFSGIIGGPMAGMLLKLDGVGHIAGWQWLFLIEGIPSVIFGIVTLFYLPDRPDRARWLAPAERDWLVEHLRQERHDSPFSHQHSLQHAFLNGKVWLLAMIYATLIFGFYGINLWMPTIIKQVSGGSNLEVGFLSAIPCIFAAVVMIRVGIHSDCTGDRRKPAAIGALFGCLGLLLVALAQLPSVHSTALCLIAFAIAAAGIWGAMGPFWVLPPTFVHGTAAAAGIALINSVGNLGGGFIGPNLMGYLKDHTQSYTPGLLIDAGACLLSAILVLQLRHKPTPPE
jgi:MFS transporter, ACS family, tartrate transporter